MRIQFPARIDQFNHAHTVGQYNAQLADNRFDARAVPYLLEAIERKIGADHSDDARSLDWRLERCETSLSALQAELTALAFLPAAGGGSNTLLGVNAAGSAYELKAIAGTPNQLTVAHSAGALTLALPQDIHSGAAPQFAGMTLAGNLHLAGGTQAVFTDASGAAAMGLYNSSSLGALDIVYDPGGGSESTVASFRATGLALGGMTAGSIPFIGAGGVLSQNNSALYWDNVNGRLGIGTTAPAAGIDYSMTTAPVLARQINGAGTYSSVQSAVQIGLSGTRPTAVGAGPSFLFFAPDSNQNKEFLGRLSAVWEDNTDGAEAGAIAFNVRANSGDTNAQTEVMRLTSQGFLVHNEVTANPTTSILSSMNKYAVYMKADKFIIAYNNGGTITFISIPMDGSSTTWTHSTTTP